MTEEVNCSLCKQLIFRNVERVCKFTFPSLKEYCYCHKCFRQLLTQNKKSLDTRQFKKYNYIELEKKYQFLKDKLYKKQLQLQNFANDNCFTLQENGSILDIFINDKMAQLMRKFTLFVEDILSKEDCLENFVTISADRLSNQLQQYGRTLIEKQTHFLIDILKTERKNNQNLQGATKKYFQQLIQSLKGLSIKSNFSKDLINQNFWIDQNIALYHSSKTKYLETSEVQSIEKILNAKMYSLKERDRQICTLIKTGSLILVDQLVSQVQDSMDEESSQSEEVKDRFQSSISNKNSNNSEQFSELNQSNKVSDDAFVDNTMQNKKTEQTKENSKVLEEYNSGW